MSIKYLEQIVEQYEENKTDNTGYDMTINENDIEVFKSVIESLKDYKRLFDITYKQYNSIEEFEKAKKEFTDE